MDYREAARAARESNAMGAWCKACPVCDGRACSNRIPGPGAKGTGTVAIRNYEAWQRLEVEMQTCVSLAGPDTSFDFMGFVLNLPVMVGPVGDVNRHYGPKFDTASYNDCVLAAASAAGSLAWTGDALDASLHERACEAISNNSGQGVPVIKPWSLPVVAEKIAAALEADPVAIAMDVDAQGLPFLKGQEPPAGPKSVAELAEIVDMCDGVPFIVKGVMNPASALRAVEAGAQGVVVSNHGGRVLDGTPATADVLASVRNAVGFDTYVLVDGGIRSGLDVFRALALGADACLVCRPFVVAAYGAGQDGVRGYLDQLAGELEDVMAMCGCEDLTDIDDSCLSGF
jgi:hypothetical protein